MELNEVMFTQYPGYRNAADFSIIVIKRALENHKNKSEDGGGEHEEPNSVGTYYFGLQCA